MVEDCKAFQRHVQADEGPDTAFSAGVDGTCCPGSASPLQGNPAVCALPYDGLNWQ